MRLDGENVTGPHPQIGMVFQEANLLPWRNLRANIEFPFEIRKEPPDRARIAHLLDEVGLGGFDEKYPRELSGGSDRANGVIDDGDYVFNKR